MRRTCAAALAALALAAPAAPAAAAEPDPAPPAPPPVRLDPPAGRPPGPAAGLRQRQQCDPAPSDAGTDDPVTTGATRLRLAELHRIATGRGQVIAVIDTGVAPHPLLGDRLRGGGDYLTGGDGLDDCDGHGTAVAGLLAAAARPGPDGRGDTPVGIAPGAELISIRQSSRLYDVPGAGGVPRPAGDVDTLAEAIVLAVRRGADVVNISEAACLPAEQAATQGALLHAALRFATEADVVVVAAAGNITPDACGPGQVALPAWYDDELLAVGAVGPDDSPAPFTVPGPWVDVAAPGTGLRSLAVGGGTTTTGVDGTSFAAPWVAGLAALLRERYPDLSAAQVADRILATARRPPGGEDDALGHGVIDPIAALTAVPEVLTPGAGPAREAELPGTAPRTEPTAPTWPADVAVVGGLLAACAAAVLFLRRGPRRADLRRTG